MNVNSSAHTRPVHTHTLGMTGFVIPFEKKFLSLKFVLLTCVKIGWSFFSGAEFTLAIAKPIKFLNFMKHPRIKPSQITCWKFAHLLLHTLKVVTLKIHVQRIHQSITIWYQETQFPSEIECAYRCKNNSIPDWFLLYLHCSVTISIIRHPQHKWENFFDNFDIV